jgi:hypothetical protein
MTNRFAKAPKPARQVAVYSGRELRGTIEIIGREFRAFAVSGHPLGIFANQKAAAVGHK